MRAMRIERIGPLADNPEPLVLAHIPLPEPGPGQVRIRVSVCAVCHTELDEIEGRTPPSKLPVVPGHQVVGRIEALGDGVTRHRIGARVGVGWIFESDGGPAENLSPQFRATGRDADGGYAEFMVVGERYAYPMPDVWSDEEAAPLLCAGAVGYRALRLADIGDGDVLGLTGFGGSGHLVLQLVRHLKPRTPVFVFARSAREREFARSLGAAWAGDTGDRAPDLAHAVIDTTPAWRPVLAALEALRPGGRLVINAIRKEAGDRELLAGLDYAKHLWLEKELKTVANVTAADIREFLQTAAAIPLKPVVKVLPLAGANRALQELRAGNLRGSYVLDVINQ